MTSPHPKTARLVVAALSMLASVGVAAAVMARFEPEVEPVAWEDKADALASLLEARRLAADEGASSPTVQALADFELRREPIDLETARILFPGVGGAHQWHPRLYYRLLPHTDRTKRFPEHPDGSFRVVTNSLGLRRSSEVRDGRPALRVLVLGDSHTEGAVAESETFSHRLEEALGAEIDGVVEVLNAGVTGYTFYNYLAVYEEYRGLRPDVVLVVSYGGNDFGEAVHLWRYFEHAQPRPRNQRPWREREVPPWAAGMISQEIEQAELFRTHPEEEQVAFAVAARAASELANLCAQDGATPVFAWLPPVSVGQPRVFGDEVERCLDVLGVRPAGLAVSERLGARWLDHLEQEGLASVDLRPILAAQDEPCYWSFDRHLNVRGHAVVAEALLPALRAALE